MDLSRRRSTVVTLLLCALSCAAPVAAQRPANGSSNSSTHTESQAAPIQDNSFLIEEAYNQEAGVVQHISTFARDAGSRAWAYTFTQEWPVFSQQHQLSYTIPVISNGPGQGSGLGDIAIHYRYQLANGKRSAIFVAPRISLIVPSGNDRKDRGAGAAGVQVNLPISIEHSAYFVTHWNAGATLTPSARNAAGDKATTRNYNLGASAIWLPLSRLNAMLEVAWSRDELVSGPDRRVGEDSFFLSPGVRGAFNFASGLQIVPGFAVPIGVGASDGEHSVFFYLSFEHPF
jgi:hypothetical protein